MSQSNRYYFEQKGGAGRQPFRYFNPGAQAFSPCSQGPAIQHGAGNSGLPTMEYNRIGLKKNQTGGSVSLPYRYFNPNAQAFSPCGCAGNACGCGNDCGCGAQTGGGKAGGVYYNEFRANEGCHAYNSCNLTGGAKKQTGGNPSHAPLHVYNSGEPLKYNFNMQDNFSGTPTFSNVGQNRFWQM